MFLRVTLILLSLFIFVSCTDDQNQAEEAVVVEENAGESTPKPAGNGEADMMVKETVVAEKQTETVQRSEPNIEAAKLATLKSDVKKQAVANLSKTDAQSMFVTAWMLNVRSGPGMKYDVVTQFEKGKQVQVLETSGVWGKIDEAKYVSLKYLSDQTP